nr:spidroin-1-like [Aegilops tauschii subsp. strangulata]
MVAGTQARGGRRGRSRNGRRPAPRGAGGHGTGKRPKRRGGGGSRRPKAAAMSAYAGCSPALRGEGQSRGEPAGVRAVTGEGGEGVGAAGHGELGRGRGAGPPSGAAMQWPEPGGGGTARGQGGADGLQPRQQKLCRTGCGDAAAPSRGGQQRRGAAVWREQRRTAVAVAGDGDGGERACVRASWTRRRRGGRLTGAVGILAAGRGEDDGDDASDDRDE